MLTPSTIISLRLRQTRRRSLDLHKVRQALSSLKIASQAEIDELQRKQRLAAGDNKTAEK